MGLQGAIRQARPHDVSDKAASARRITSIVSSGTTSKRALGFRLHLCRNLDWLRVRRFRYRRLCRRIVGWRYHGPRTRASCSTRWNKPSMTASPCIAGLVHHSDRGSQYVSIKYTERLAEAASSPPSAASAIATTTRCGDDQRPLQGRSHPSRGPWRSFEASSSLPSNGGLVQQPRLLEPIATFRRRSRGALLRHTGKPSYALLNQRLPNPFVDGKCDTQDHHLW